MAASFEREAELKNLIVTTQHYKIRALRSADLIKIVPMQSITYTYSYNRKNSLSYKQERCFG